jgi:hypothetical protein
MKFPGVTARYNSEVNDAIAREKQIRLVRAEKDRVDHSMNPEWRDLFPLL